MKVYQKIATLVAAIHHCRAIGNTEWEERHELEIERLVKIHLPHGSGLDAGVNFKLDLSSADKLVFLTAFHHMNEHGYYDGWSNHALTVRPSLAFGYDLKIGGPNRNDIKDYLYDIFRESLCEEASERPVPVEVAA